jgi:hypothetical protein
MAPLSRAASEQRFTHQGAQHQQQADLPPALLVFDILCRLPRVDELAAAPSIDGIRKLFRGSRGRV